jgi:hypothetical protein
MGQQLEGQWTLSPANQQEGKASAHPEVSPLIGTDQVAMNFKLIANGSTVQEDLLPKTSRQMVTMYHCKDDTCSAVKATHYCVKQNQPELLASLESSAEKVVLECDMSTELCQSWDDHIHRITHELSNNGTHLRTVYSSFMNGEHAKDTIYHFDRILISNSSGSHALAGQICPGGSFLIGFDSSGDIICTEASSNTVLNIDEVCDDGRLKTADGCLASGQSDGIDTGSDDEEPVEKTSVTVLSSVPPISEPVISDVKPSKVVFGISELAITVTGKGFNAESVIIFEGLTHESVVNEEGTQLKTRIETGDLSIGLYAITVSNGSGLENTLKKALYVY